jgi:hypothetical protein
LVRLTDGRSKSGLGSRPSEKVTAWRFGNMTHSFKSTFAYDQLGEIATTGYPDYQGYAHAGEGPARSVAYQRQQVS